MKILKLLQVITNINYTRLNNKNIKNNGNNGMSELKSRNFNAFDGDYVIVRFSVDLMANQTNL